MSVDDREILHAVKDALQNDPTLAGYVKHFSVGENDVSRKLYPFINVGNLKYDIEPLSLSKHGSDKFDYTLEITGGIKSLAAKTAFAGDDSGRKGIIQLREDILKVLRPNDFGGVFCGLVEIPAAMIGYKKNTGGTNWITSIMISGSRTVPKIDRDTTGCTFKKLNEERYTDAEVCAKIMETIRGAAELSYVKSFTIGDMNVSRALYPFINVGNTHVSVEAHDIVNDIRRYAVTLTAGTHCLSGNHAYDGNGDDMKGIVELCSDIVSVVRQNYFGGVFFKPVQSLSVDTEALSDKAGFMRIGTIRFTGECFVRR